METTKIGRVRIIKNDKDGNRINIVVIDLANGKPSIVRNEKQFLTDLEDSGLITGNVQSLQHPQIAKLKNHLAKGSISGDFTHHKKGSKWTVTEDSRVITDSTHPEYGKVAVGDQLVSEQDRTIVDGFLFLERSLAVEQMYINADAKAQAELAQEGVFDAFTVASETPIGVDDLPADLLASATSGESNKPSKK